MRHLCDGLGMFLSTSGYADLNMNAPFNLYTHMRWPAHVMLHFDASMHVCVYLYR